MRLFEKIVDIIHFFIRGRKTPTTPVEPADSEKRALKEFFDETDLEGLAYYEPAKAEDIINNGGSNLNRMLESASRGERTGAHISTRCNVESSFSRK